MNKSVKEMKGETSTKSGLWSSNKYKSGREEKPPRKRHLQQEGGTAVYRQMRVSEVRGQESFQRGEMFPR